MEIKIEMPSSVKIMFDGKDIKLDNSDKPVTERVKTFEDACRELGDNHPLVCDYKAVCESGRTTSKHLLAYMKLCIICDAVNEKWEPKSGVGEEFWYPYFRLYTQREIDNMDELEKECCHLIPTDGYLTKYAGFGFMDSGSLNAFVSTPGSHLYYKSEKLAKYCGRQFIDLWADFYLVRK